MALCVFVMGGIWARIKYKNNIFNAIEMVNKIDVSKGILSVSDNKLCVVAYYLLYCQTQSYGQIRKCYKFDIISY